LAGHDSHNAVERARLGQVETEDFAMAHGAAKDATDQCIRLLEVRRVACAPGDLLDAVDERHASAL
jgi:hypothetical protein